MLLNNGTYTTFTTETTDLYANNIQTNFVCHAAAVNGGG